MAFTGERRFVGIGFGAIQAGLFVYEADRTNAYAQPLVVDIRSDLVAGLRAAGGRFRLNIARDDRVDVAEVGPIEILDSTSPVVQQQIIEAIAAADELATALPSVDVYRTGAPSSPHRLLAAALGRRTRPDPLIVYCAENRRHAAAMLQAAVLDVVGTGERVGIEGRAAYVDTVIGKMSGVITDPAELRSLGVATITPTLSAAFLVEAFDRILVSRVDPAGARHPGMPVLREVDDLGPFEDAKLLGHNATHALAGFLGQWLGLVLVAELRAVPGAMDFLRRAFIEESGAALIARHAGVDRLFTPAGYAEFADDLLIRMVNPHLADTIERAARDPVRKLGWDDRLVGLIRLGLMEGVPTPRYAMGVAAGIDLLRRDGAIGSDVEILTGIWPAGVAAIEADAVLDAVSDGRSLLARWQADGFEGLAVGHPGR